MILQVGDVVQMRPEILSSKLEEDAAKRFYTVEFTSEFTGERWRECVYFN